MQRPWPLLALLALLLLAGGRASAQEGPSLSVDPVAQAVEPDAGPFEVRILVDDVTTPQGLGGYTLVMSYDPSVVQARTIADSGFVASTENPVICPSSGIDNDAGRLAHLCLTIPILAQPGPQTSEPRVLARITFEPVGEGLTTLDISETTLIDPEGNELAATATSGAVTVGSGITPQLTQPALDAEETESDGGGNAGLLIGLGIAAFVIVALLGVVALLRRRRAAGS